MVHHGRDIAGLAQVHKNPAEPCFCCSSGCLLADHESCLPGYLAFNGEDDHLLLLLVADPKGGHGREVYYGFFRFERMSRLPEWGAAVREAGEDYVAVALKGV